MARTISAQGEVNRLRFLILRSLFYKQGLPSDLVYGPKSAGVSSEMNAITELQLARRTREGLEITSLGQEYLYKLSGNKKPPLIDAASSVVLPRKKRKEFIVRSSLAAEIFREVRNGE